MSQTENSPGPVQRWTAKRKASVVLEILRGETIAVETTRKRGLRPKAERNLVRALRTGMLAGGSDVAIAKSRSWALTLSSMSSNGIILNLCSSSISSAVMVCGICRNASFHPAILAASRNAAREASEKSIPTTTFISIFIVSFLCLEPEEFWTHNPLVAGSRPAGPTISPLVLSQIR